MRAAAIPWTPSARSPCSCCCPSLPASLPGAGSVAGWPKIGRASCRERAQVSVAARAAGAIRVRRTAPDAGARHARCRGCPVVLFEAEDGIRDFHVTGVQTCALPISLLVMLLLGADAGSGDTLDAIGKITVQLLLPFIAGQFARRWIGGWVA